MHLLRKNQVLFFSNLIVLNIRKAARFVTTTLAPAGIEKLYDMTIPAVKQIMDIIEEQIITNRKLFPIRMDVSAGNIIRLEIRSAPIMRIPTTIVAAVSSAISMLWSPEFIPVAFAKRSSKVTAKILL